MKSVKEHVGYQVCVEIHDQVSYKILRQVYVSVGDPVDDQVWDQVANQVLNKVEYYEE